MLWTAKLRENPYMEGLTEKENDNMKKIRLFPAPHLEIRVYVSDEMRKDFQECLELSEKGDWETKDCAACSWRQVALGDVHMCELKEMEGALNRGEINKE